MGWQDVGMPTRLWAGKGLVCEMTATGTITARDEFLRLSEDLGAPAATTAEMPLPESPGEKGEPAA